MNLQLFLLLIVVVTALAFDFTNGFHDTGNAMATSIASGALAPRVAVALSAVLNLIGAFLSTAVAATIAKGLIDANLVTLELVFAGLVGGIVWNLLTWLLGIPSSSSHALIGGIVGATIAAVGLRGVIWSGVVSKVIVPAVVAALLATLVGAVGTWLVYRTTRGVAEKRTERGFRRGQIGSASLVSLAHGTNDAQKDDGRDLPGVDVLRRGHHDGIGAAAVGDRELRRGHGRRYLPGWLAHHPHPRQRAGRDQTTAGYGRRVVIGRRHSVVRALRLCAVHNAGRDRVRAGQRRRQARRRGALGGSRPHGGRVAGDAPVGRAGRGLHLRAGAFHRWLPRCDPRFRTVVADRHRHLAAVAQGADRPHQRQRRLGRQPDGRPGSGCAAACGSEAAGACTAGSDSPTEPPSTTVRRHHEERPV
ncbi:LOW QUALITY PROTEIN: predicted protein, partial [Mycobacterium tuberculosis T85]